MSRINRLVRRAIVNRNPEGVVAKQVAKSVSFSLTLQPHIFHTYCGMKTQNLRQSRLTSLSNTRWLAYATASAATSFVGANVARRQSLNPPSGAFGG